MPDDKLEALMAELRAIELWNQTPEEFVPGNEIYKVGGEARQMGWLEIIRQIDVLLRKTDRDSEQCCGLPVCPCRDFELSSS